MFDPNRRPTAFQWRVLHVVRAEGPISVAGIQTRMQQQGNAAIRSACWILRCGGYLSYADGQVDVTAAGRHVIALIRERDPQPALLTRLIARVRRQLAPFSPLADRTDSAGV